MPRARLALHGYADIYYGQLWINIPPSNRVRRRANETERTNVAQRVATAAAVH